MNALAAPRVLLLRTPDTPDPYEAALEAAGFVAQSMPVLAFTFVNEGRLREALAQPATYAGLILTSARGAEALARLDVDLAAWRDKPTWTVGPKTAAHLQAVGLSAQGETAGDAVALAARIVERPVERPWLFLCGDRRRDELPERLVAARVPFNEIVVYQTTPRRDLDAQRLSTAEWVVFFSPAGVEAVRQRIGGPPSGRCAAIGATTAASLEAAGWAVAAVAATPTPEGLVAALQEAAS